MEVIGAGWSRTGTRSLHAALEILNYNCYHGYIISVNDELIQKWYKAICVDKQLDFDALYDGYNAGVDVPTACYYESLLQQNEHAKVILTLRDSNKWYDSVKNSLYLIDNDWSRIVNNWFCSRGFMFHQSVVPCIYRICGGMSEFHNRKKTIECFEAWNAGVRRTVPKDKLLVFDVSEGWEPLCKFLNKPVPSVEFPRINESGRFQEVLIAQRKTAGARLWSIAMPTLGFLYCLFASQQVH